MLGLPSPPVMFFLYLLARYNERVVWNDKQMNLKLLRKGVLTRIYTPMVRNNACVKSLSISMLSNAFFLRQAIVQGLRESGVFTSVIAAGQPAVNEKLSPKKTDAQSQNVTRLGNLPIKLRASDSKASARKILQAELVFNDTDVTAVPPMSPPGLDDEHRHHSE
jgi:hypothetical protein